MENNITSNRIQAHGITADRLSIAAEKVNLPFIKFEKHPTYIIDCDKITNLREIVEIIKLMDIHITIPIGAERLSTLKHLLKEKK